MLLFRAALTFIVLMQATSVLRAAEIRFFCTDALAPSMGVLVPQFETASGHHVKTTVANAGTIAARLQSGEAADVAVVLPPAWDRLRQEGRIDPAVRIVLGRVGLGVFVRRGAEKPDISTVESFNECKKPGSARSGATVAGRDVHSCAIRPAHAVRGRQIQTQAHDPSSIPRGEQGRSRIRLLHISRDRVRTRRRTRRAAATSSPGAIPSRRWPWVVLSDSSVQSIRLRR